MMVTDGAADKVTKLPKTLNIALDFFHFLKSSVLIHEVNAAVLPGFNRVERCTAPLLHDHSGLILTHDSFGNHLGENVETTDIDLEIRNFFKTAEVLSDVWPKTVINRHPLNCVEVPVGQSYEPPISKPTWVTEHVQQS